MAVELGIIEGFYGRPWSWQERIDTVSFLGPRGYGFYLYAPKLDPYLRKRWQEDPPEEEAGCLRAFADRCREAGVRFGVGLSPYELWLDFGRDARDRLREKLRWLDGIGVQDLAILFDDMRGDLPDLAERQAEIVEHAAEATGADRLFVCPSYYSDDPVLDAVFGARPAGYLERLGALLDPSVEIFWTGEEVCSREISPGHLRRVTERLGRRPFLWDNYPVNDGQRMSRHLHLRAFTGRPATLADHVAGHGINPALQPTLTRIPALTLVESYRRGEEYRYGDALRDAAEEVLGPELAEKVVGDLRLLQDEGLERLGEKRDRLVERYDGMDHPGAGEIVGWLRGEYRVTDAMMREDAAG